MVDGRALRVVNPGRPGLGAGPDFLDAVVEIDGMTVRGDVELHVRSSGFRAHGHDRDPAYDGVALHVVFRADDGAETGLSNGCRAPVAAFAPWFDTRRDELQRWLGAEALWQEPCRDAVWRLGEDEVRGALREAGRRRFRARVQGLRSQVAEAGEEETLWRGLFDVIGVGGDREGYRRLAAAFPASLARELVAAHDGEEASSLLASAMVYVAGLGEASDLPAGLPAPLRPAVASSGRPANRPERRLRGIAALFVRGHRALAPLVRESVAKAPSVKALVTAWQVSQRGLALIGPDRAREIVLNLVLPFVASDAVLGERAAALVDELGAAPAYGKTAFLESNLRSAAGKRLVRRAVEQQGLLAFLGEWCSRGGCGRCPLS